MMMGNGTCFFEELWLEGLIRPQRRVLTIGRRATHALVNDIIILLTVAADFCRRHFS